MRAALILALTALVTLACLLLVLSRDAPQHTSLEPPLPKIAPAPGFALTSQDGAAVTLADFRGRVLAVTFIRWSWAHWRPGATLKVIVHDTFYGPTAAPVSAYFISGTICRKWI
jgi:hypothetical protein